MEKKKIEVTDILLLEEYGKKIEALRVSYGFKQVTIRLHSTFYQSETGVGNYCHIRLNGNVPVDKTEELKNFREEITKLLEGYDIESTLAFEVKATIWRWR